MTRPSASRHLPLVFSGLALLSFLARTFVDYRFVYAEIAMTTRGLGVAMLITLAIVGAWIWALVAASHDSRRGMAVLLAGNLLVVVFGAATVASFCPPPCRTGWPVGSIAIWSNLVIGIPAAYLAGRALVTMSKSAPTLD